MPLNPAQRKLRATIACAASRGNPAAEARQQFKAMGAEEYIRRLVDDAPPLTDEQRRRLAVLLHPQGVA